jgi:hypothetical protein
MSTYRLTLIFLVIASPAFGQVRVRPPVADSSTAQIMAHVRDHPDAAWLRDVLRQTSGRDAPTKLDEIADSLVVRAIDARQALRGAPAHAIASAAVGALVSAGLPTATGGHPYAGAFDRLVRVHQHASAGDVRLRALGGLLSVASPRTRAIAYLRAVAESNDPTAANAMEFLITDARGGSWGGVSPTPGQQRESMAALKGMAAANRVTDARASDLLGGWLAATQSQKPN